ncbi:LysR family transcriptional regulator [Alicyclobacillus sp. ALC3]|uniref:LysR family transcriptional regulator n=1 Tax=Alicyclobacillus sp. ALC3 TaxID=2796143 RepID=UPI002378EA59|nr:LysR family transcriptional regulator [Alicyclobacillus sp. ALC3]WDL97724.1 LysR family transcriptional regulator [Alicyclobacillus sp. ALC3]
MDRYMRTFVSVAENQSFTRAADLLHLTQSAVSREIETLEREYGAKLLDRTNKFVRLTRAGEILYFHAKTIVSEYERARTLIHDLTHEPVGRLSIGSSYSFGEYMLPHIIAEFKHRYPLVTPKITIMNSKRIRMQVVQRQADLGIIEGTVHEKDMEVRPFATDELVLIVPPDHRFSGVDEIEIGEFESDTWILREPGSGTRDSTDQTFLALGFTPASVMEFGSTQIIKESVRAGLGVAVVSKFAIQTDLRFGLLRALRIKGHPIHRDFFCATNASHFRTKALDLFIDYLCQWRYPQ